MIVGSEEQLRRRLEHDGCTPDEIEAVIGTWADDEFDRQRDADMMSTIEQREHER